MAVPLAVVAGFLGSGKTTFLHQLHTRYTGRRIAWVVNDFGAIDVDGARLRQHGMLVQSVAGGSLFCHCLASTFNSVFSEIARQARQGELDGVVVEASGISRPEGSRLLLDEFGLSDALVLVSVTTVVDPLTLPALMEMLPAVISQIRYADTILINKSDLASAAQLTESERRIRTINPGAHIHITTGAVVDMDVLGPPGPGMALAGKVPSYPDPSFFRFAATTHERVMDVKRLMATLEAAGNSLFRVKGTIMTLEGWRYIDYSASGWRVEAGGTPETGGLVIIAPSEACGPAQRVARDLLAGRYEAKGHV